MQPGSWHESLRTSDETPASSNRSFGLVFAGGFTALGLLSLWRGHSRGAWELGAAAVFLLASLTVPAALAPLNRAWTWFGLRLNRVMSPVLMTVLFYAVVTPVGIIMRAAGGDPLRLRTDAAAASYWIERPRRDNEASSMTRQF